MGSNPGVSTFNKKEVKKFFMLMYDKMSTHLKSDWQGLIKGFV